MLNKLSVTGRICRDLELNTMENGKTYLSFSIANERNYIDKRTNERPVNFFEAIAYGSTAEFICKYFIKGDTIIIAGEIESSNYKDRNGNNRTSFAIKVDEAYFGQSKPNKKERQDDTGTESENDVPPIENCEENKINE